MVRQARNNEAGKAGHDGERITNTRRRNRYRVDVFASTATLMSGADQRPSEAEKFFGSNQQTEPAHEEQNKGIGGYKKPERGRVLGTII